MTETRTPPAVPPADATPTSGSRPAEPTRGDDERYALQLVPIAKEIAEFVRARIPEGADYGVLLFAKPTERGGEGRVIALTSNRDRVAPLAAQWVLSVMHNPTQD